jgi:hypothetical protein
MRKLTIALTAITLGTMALQANAQSQQSGAAAMHALAQNATPIVKQAACRGFGPYCPPGWVRRCGPFRCRCVPC